MMPERSLDPRLPMPLASAAARLVASAGWCSHRISSKTPRYCHRTMTVAVKLIDVV